MYVRLQGKDRKRSRQVKVKVGIVYDGWKQIGKEGYDLLDEVVVTGFEEQKNSMNTMRRQLPGI